MDDPLLLHCHIPKTAGISVSRILRGSFDLFHFNHYHPDPGYILTPSILKTLLEIDPLLKSITSHSLRTFPQYISGRPAFYITFLRKPADIFVSLLRYTKQEFANLSTEALKNWPANTPQLALRDLAAAILDRWGENPRYCPISNFFCLPQTVERFHPGGNYYETSQEITSSILQKFLLVGFVEEMPKSIKLLKAKLQKLDLVLKPPLLHRFNRTRGSKDISWLNERDPVGAKVLEATAFETSLYNQFHRRFLDEYAAMIEGRLSDLPEEQREFPTLEEWAAAAYQQKVRLSS